MTQPVETDLVEQQHGLARCQPHGSADGLVAAAGLQVRHVGRDLLAALLLQDIEHAAAQVDAGVVPVAKQGAGQIINGVDDRGGVGEDALFDADHLIPRFNGQVAGQLGPGADGIDLDAIGVGVAAKAADQRVVFQLLVQPAAQVEYRAVDHGADAAHSLDVTGALHLAQSIADDRAADAELCSQIDFCGQTVCVGVAPGAQFLQQGRHNAVADDGPAQADRRRAGIFHRLYPPVHGREAPAWTFRKTARQPQSFTGQIFLCSL